MKIKMYWPNCDLVFKDVKFNGEDAFFLECSLEEARKYVFSNLTEKEIEQCLRDYEPEPNQNLLNSGIETNRICVLVTKDQKSLLPASWRFPYSGQWNAYCPFRRIKETEMNDISEISRIVVETQDGDNDVD